MSQLNLNDFINNDNSDEILLGDRVFKLNASLKTMIHYQNLLNKFKNNKEYDVELFGSEILNIIFGEQQYKEFNLLLNELVKHPKQKDDVLLKVFEKWMELMGLPINKDGDTKK